MVNFVKTKINHQISGVVLGIIVLLSGFTIYTAWSIAISQMRRLTDTQPFVSQEAKQRMVADIIKSGNIGQCAKARGLIIDGINYETVCKNNIASSQARVGLDTTYCDYLEDPAFTKDDCRSYVVTQKAIRAGDQSSCATLSEKYKSQCELAFWNQSAIVQKDIKLCERITMAANQVQCRDEYLMKKLMADYVSINCTELSSALKPYCESYQKVMRSGKNCDDVAEPRLRSACIEQRSK